MRVRASPGDSAPVVVEWEGEVPVTTVSPTAATHTPLAMALAQVAFVKWALGDRVPPAVAAAGRELMAMLTMGEPWPPK